jgi:hypothetical protein
MLLSNVYEWIELSDEECTDGWARVLYQVIRMGCSGGREGRTMCDCGGQTSPACLSNVCAAFCVPGGSPTTLPRWGTTLLIGTKQLGHATQLDAAHTSGCGVGASATSGWRCRGGSLSRPITQIKPHGQGNR